MVFIIGVIAVYKASPLIYEFWIGEDVIIDRKINFAVFIYVLVMSWNALFAHFLNAMSLNNNRKILCQNLLD